MLIQVKIRGWRRVVNTYFTANKSQRTAIISLGIFDQVLANINAIFQSRGIGILRCKPIVHRENCQVSSIGVDLQKIISKSVISINLKYPISSLSL